MTDSIQRLLNTTSLDTGTSKALATILEGLNDGEIPFTSTIGGVERTLAEKAQETVSAEDLGLVGDDSTDNSAAFTAALLSLPDQITIVFGRGKYRFSGTHTIRQNYLAIKGQGRYATELKYTGGAGTFLKFQETTGTLDQFGLQLRDFYISATDTSASKTAIELVDSRTTELKNIGIGTWSGGDSICLHVRGRELLRVSRCSFGGGSGSGKAVPVRLSANPNTDPVGWLSADIFRFEHCLFVCTTATDTLPHTGVLIDDAAQVNKTDFDTIVVAGGKYGIYWSGPTAVGSHVNDSLNIRNFRKEQTPAAQTGAYAVYVSVPTDGLSNLLIEDFTGENSTGRSGGIYVRGAVNLNMRNITQYGGAVSAFDVDARVVALHGLETASTATFAVGSDMDLSWATHRDRAQPSSAVWVKQSPFRNLQRPNMRIGDLSVLNFWLDMADDTSANLPVSADQTNVAGGIVEVWAYGSGTTYAHGVFGMSTGNIGTNGVAILSDTASNCAVADTDTKLCVYASGASPMYAPVVIKNRLGSTMKVLIMCRYYRNANN